jgi:hypothetical protein
VLYLVDRLLGHLEHALEHGRAAGRVLRHCDRVIRLEAHHDLVLALADAHPAALDLADAGDVSHDADLLAVVGLRILQDLGDGQRLALVRTGAEVRVGLLVELRAGERGGGLGIVGRGLGGGLAGGLARGAALSLGGQCGDERERGERAECGVDVHRGKCSEAGGRAPSCG